MEHVRRVSLLCWLLFGLFGVIIVSWNIWSWQYVVASIEVHVLFTLLVLIQASLYGIEVSLKLEKRFSWLLLGIQTGLIFLLTQLTHLVIITLIFSLILFVVATFTIEQIRILLVALGSYLVLLLLYMNTVGPDQEWQAIWSGGYAPEVAILGLFFLVVLMLYLHQEQHAHEQTKSLLHQLDTAHAQMSAYALRVEELTMITERQRIARDLHDTVIQGMVGLVMQVEVAQAHLQHQKVERAQEIMQQVLESARDSIVDARCAIGDLRTTGIRPDDLSEIVQEEISRFTATTEIPCHADLALLSTTPTPLCEQVLRVITEGLTNIARHAHAHTVWIQTTQRHEMLIIEVRDDGVGFEPTTISTHIGHYGLVGLRERTKLIGGGLEIISGAGAGTILRVHIPNCFPGDQKGVAIWQSVFVS